LSRSRISFQSYGGRPILERVSVEAEEGEFVSIVGASGCGKSTFLRLLLDQERPTRGGITVDGEPLKGEPDRSRGIVFQRYSVFPHLSVRDNIVAAEGLSRPLGRLFGSVKRAARARADEALERIGLSHVADQYPSACRGACSSGWPSRRRWRPKPRHPAARRTLRRARSRHAGADARVFAGPARRDADDRLHGHPRPAGGVQAGRPGAGLRQGPLGPARPAAYGATITYDFDARNGGIPFQLAEDARHARPGRRFPPTRPTATRAGRGGRGIRSSVKRRRDRMTPFERSRSHHPADRPSGTGAPITPT
jgi:NitT/TauT family transport system ATP-binding protein